MENFAFIINPHSAKGKYRKLVEKLEQKLQNPQIYISESLAGTREFIRNSWDKTRVYVAVGGDGTISSVAAELIHSDKILAIFPAGSGNGFARETAFNKDLDNLLRKLKRNNFREVDTFRVNDFFSINVSGIGFDGNVTRDFEKTSRGLKNYIKVSVQTFFRFNPVGIRFLEENFQKYDGKYLMLNFANTRQFGNNAYIAPFAEMDDGLIEVVLVKPFPLWYGAVFAARMFLKILKTDRYVTYLSVPRISFEADSVNWHIDGDFKEITSPVSVEIQPKSLKVLV